MKKIAIVGGPSTGKTVLTQRLAKRLQRRKYKIGIVDDQARIYIEKWIRGKRRMAISDQLWILRDWIKREKELEAQNYDFLLCDGASFLSYNYCFLFEPKEKEGEAWDRFRLFKNKIFEIVKENLLSYDYIFFLPMEFPPKKDGLRLWTDKAYLISLSIRAFLDTYLWQDPRWHVIRGSAKERVDKILEIILKD